jgi:hypothetical protein
LSGLPDGGSGAGTSSSAAPDPRSVRPGDRLRVAVPGRFEGVVGVVVKRARTRYHLRIDGGVLTVPFACVERPS